MYWVYHNFSVENNPSSIKNSLTQRGKQGKQLINKKARENNFEKKHEK